jgi:KTSC domain
MVSDIGYSDAGELLVTWAKSGKTSAYSGVPEGLADEISRSPSVGESINSQVKGVYAHRYV